MDSWEIGKRYQCVLPGGEGAFPVTLDRVIRFEVLRVMVMAVRLASGRVMLVHADCLCELAEVDVVG